MGHLFRALNFIKCLEKHREKYVVILNDDDKAKTILKQKGITFETADINDYAGDWETRLIRKYNLHAWINDRLDTERKHAENVKKNKISHITFDDCGTGSELADINFGLMPCNYNNNLKGKIIKRGIDYFIVNEQVDKYKRKRRKMEKIVVTLGGSDTYGVTLKVAQAVRKLKLDITIIIGPSFQHQKELSSIAGNTIVVKNTVPSLIEEFYNYDLAITGGGITPFEANASGLPCVIIANEPHEVLNGKFLEQSGSSIFIGYYTDADFSSIPFDKIDIQQMSAAGLNTINTKGAENIYNTIKNL